MTLPAPVGALVTTLRDGIARRFGTATDGPTLRHDGELIEIDVGAVA